MYVNRLGPCKYTTYHLLNSSHRSSAYAFVCDMSKSPIRQIRPLYFSPVCSAYSNAHTVTEGLLHKSVATNYMGYTNAIDARGRQLIN